jgi:hypothetical protein
LTSDDGLDQAAHKLSSVVFKIGFWRMSARKTSFEKLECVVGSAVASKGLQSGAGSVGFARSTSFED